ncbi:MULTISPECIES: arsenate reductase (azurin) small subunit [Paraburkholderia]|uniref:Arsenite oxidase small subunit n=2 Tax=Paraburkholderia TaxID=1822464 RepID=A0A7Z0B631_9BURK|nr:arsenate reductase (azurin) small subunit [Paraburkholderia bryophila]NYH18796.1 arsenite oxidase small subunit [Paraburkholderia bryophila]NYH21723.1 arsenite oxidase small subunit [Paraburkholderia bryophila]
MSELKVGRRTFLKLSGGSIAATAASALAPNVASAANPVDTSKTNLPYPRKPVAHAGSMALNAPVSFTYPDAASPCVAIKMGGRVPGGVGPDGDIVAYSAMCTHMGCPVMYEPATKVFKCPCHFSMFDAEKAGQMIIGQATENLPRVRLQYDEKTGGVTAIGVDGLIYGRQANVL